MVGEACRLAERLLAPVGDRWGHTRGVAARAAAAVAAVADADRPVLVAAAYLHDVGYAPDLSWSTFHPVDGARFLAQRGWPELVVGLVAQHSGARFVAAARGLSDLLEPFADDRFTTGPLADALTFADQTTAPDGSPVDAGTRLADMLRRHGPDSPNARCHHVRGPALLAAVAATERRISAAA
ncbi:HD domain-containing protein [Geodermatophilus marinus]|nr:HD domain-containing protein [Geodermatophilus sp. LHW52908]